MMTARQLVSSRFARFLALSAVSFGLNFGITAGLHEVLGQPEELAFAVGIVVVFFFNFFASRYFVYRSTEGDPRRQFIKFLLSSGAFRVLQYLGFLLVHTVMGVHYLVAVVLVLGVSIFAKFIFYGSVVFTNDREAP